MYDTRRTVTWERYALVLNGFHERVLRSLRYMLIDLTRNLIFAGKVPFPRAGHIYNYIYVTVSGKRVHSAQNVHSSYKQL